jgi:hypothetical protein
VNVVGKSRIRARLRRSTLAAAGSDAAERLG